MQAVTREKNFLRWVKKIFSVETGTETSTRNRKLDHVSHASQVHCGAALICGSTGSRFDFR